MMSIKKFPSRIFISCALGLTAACVPMSPIVRLEPSRPTTITAVANRPALSLTVQDTRSDKTLGTVPSPQEGGAPITMTPEVPVQNVLEQKVIEGLTAAGFQVFPTSSAGTASLTLDIAGFHYTKSPPPDDSGLTAYGKIIATGKNKEKTLTKTYLIEDAKKFPLGLTHDGLQQFLSDALSDGLKALLTDDALLQFLAEKR